MYIVCYRHVRIIMSNCLICAEDYSEIVVPLSFECGHLVCCSCVSEMTKIAKDGNLSCPMCNKFSKLPLEPKLFQSFTKSYDFDASKCENCAEQDFEYYCEDCKKYLCIDCNKDAHKRGKSLRHNYYEVYGRNDMNAKSSFCSEHPNVEIRWFCKTCDHAICEQCCDSNGSHRKHDFVLCSSMANTLIESVQEMLSKSTSKEKGIYNALNTLEGMQYKLGAPGIITFEKANPFTDHQKTHITIREMSISKVNDHYESIMSHVRKLHEKHLKLIEDITQLKSDTWMKHTENLHMNLIHLDSCVKAVNELTTLSPLEVCLQYPYVVKMIQELENEWSSVSVYDDSDIPIFTKTNDVIVTLDKSCSVVVPPLLIYTTNSNTATTSVLQTSSAFNSASPKPVTVPPPPPLAPKPISGTLNNGGNLQSSASPKPIANGLFDEYEDDLFGGALKAKPATAAMTTVTMSQKKVGNRAAAYLAAASLAAKR